MNLCVYISNPFNSLMIYENAVTDGKWKCCTVWVTGSCHVDNSVQSMSYAYGRACYSVSTTFLKSWKSYNYQDGKPGLRLTGSGIKIFKFPGGNIFVSYITKCTWCNVINLQIADPWLCIIDIFQFCGIANPTVVSCILQ